MVRLFYIISILVLGSIAAQAQKTVIEEGGIVKSVHKERGKKQVHITYYDNGQKKSWMKVTPDWVKEKEWYRDGQKKKHVVYSQVSFTADYKKYIVWDEEGNKVENKGFPDEAILVADYTEVGAANSEQRAEKKERGERGESEESGVSSEESGVENGGLAKSEKLKAKKASSAKTSKDKSDDPYERRTQPGQDNMKSDVTFHTSEPSATTDIERSRDEEEVNAKSKSQEEMYIERVDVDEEMASLDGSGGFRMYVVEEPEEVLASYQGTENSKQSIEVSEEDEFPEVLKAETFKPKPLDITKLVVEMRPPLRLYQTDGSTYETTLAEADMAFDNGEYDLANDYYNKAAEEKPQAAYVQDRIRKIQLINWVDGGEMVVLDEPVYNESNPIPIDAPFPEGLVYRVQLVAVSGDVPYKAMPPVAPIAGMTVRGNLKRFMAGEFRSFDSAEDAMHQIHKLGVDEAFIIAFEDGEYISVNRAMAIEKNDSNKDKDLLTSY